MPESNKDELAVVYAALLLHDSKKTITAENLNAVLGAANVKVSRYYPEVFAKVFGSGKNLGDYLKFGGGGAAPAAAPAGGAASAGAAKEEKEEKKEEKEEEEDADMGLGLFD